MPTISEALLAAGQLYEAGQFAQSERVCREILTSDPRYWQATRMLALVAIKTGRHAEARQHLQQVLALEPRDADTHFQLGNLETIAENWTAAANCYQLALTARPDWPLAETRLGIARQSLGQLNAASQHYERALQLDPNQAQARYNWGVLRRQQGRPAEAAEQFRRLLGLVGNHAAALVNLGAIYQESGELSAALDCFERALAVEPAAADAHYNRALILLARGDLAAGWQEYQWRMRLSWFPIQRRSEPVWNGSPIPQQTLLVHAEQGLGDTLHFIRYTPLARERCGRLIVQVQDPLVPLLKQSGFEVMGQNADLPRCDYQIPLVSLPGALGTTLANVPASIPYLSSSHERLAAWQAELGGMQGLKVGIVWQGSPAQAGDPKRSIPLAQFEPLARIAGVTLVSLQKHAGVEQLSSVSFPVHQFQVSWDEQSGAFVDTAAIMQNLDLVITADTAAAHLAGALGVQVWTALPVLPDWRWMLDRDDTPWYPTMTLFRQQRAGDWPTVFARTAQRLDEVARAHRDHAR